MAALIMDGYDEAIAGVVETPAGPLVVYDYEKVIDVNMEMGMSREEAIEYFYFNQAGAHMGDGTPLFMYDYDTYDFEVEID